MVGLRGGGGVGRVGCVWGEGSPGSLSQGVPHHQTLLHLPELAEVLAQPFCNHTHPPSDRPGPCARRLAPCPAPQIRAPLPRGDPQRGPGASPHPRARVPARSAPRPPSPPTPPPCALPRAGAQPLQGPRGAPQEPAGPAAQEGGPGVGWHEAGGAPARFPRAPPRPGWRAPHKSLSRRCERSWRGRGRRGPGVRGARRGRSPGLPRAPPASSPCPARARPPRGRARSLLRALSGRARGAREPGARLPYPAWSAS